LFGMSLGLHAASVGKRVDVRPNWKVGRPCRRSCGLEWGVPSGFETRFLLRTRMLRRTCIGWQATSRALQRAATL